MRGQPGITITELAAKMGIKQNYPYRVLPGLAQDGKLENKGRGYPPPRRREDQPLASITGFSWVKE